MGDRDKSEGGSEREDVVERAGGEAPPPPPPPTPSPRDSARVRKQRERDRGDRDV